MRKNNNKNRSKLNQYEFKSKFESIVGDYIQEQERGLQYEVDNLPYTQPEVKRKYKPDFKIADDVYIECKGIFSLEDRKKMLLVKEQHPDKVFYILFYNAHQKLRKGSKTTYAEWCDKHGFIWADWFKSGRSIPKEWFDNNNKAGQQPCPNKGESNGS